MACNGGDTDTDTTTATDTTTDTATDTATDPVVWQDLPGPCEAPDSVAQDPLLTEPYWDGEDIQTMQLLVELVEAEVHLDQGLLYASGQSGLQSFTVDPVTGELAWLSMYPDTGHGRFERMERLDETHLALAARSNSLEIVDVSDPTAPQAVSVFRESGLTGMHHQDGVLYVTSQQGYLLTLTVDSGYSVKEVDRLNGLASPWEVVRVGDRLYVADQTLGVVVFDVSEPEQPVFVASVLATSGALDIQTDDSFLYVAVGTAGVEIFDLADPDLPVSVGRLDSGTPVVSLAVSGDNLWTVDHDGIMVASVADPTAPMWLGFERTLLYALHVTADGDRAWVADWTNVPGYSVIAGVESPAARPSPSRVFLARADEAVTLSLRNDGAAPLTLYGGSVDDERIGVQISGTTAAPGEAILVQLVAGDDGTDLDAILCLATDDPQDPVMKIEVGAASFNSDGPGDGLQIGESAPDFALEDLDGNSWRLSEQLGHPVVLLYFATW
jgi:outer membrane protein assembly factor BamB